MSGTADENDFSFNETLSRLTLVETTNAELKESNSVLKYQLEEADATLQMAVQAILGVRNTIVIDICRRSDYLAHRIAPQATKYESEFF